MENGPESLEGRIAGKGKPDRRLTCHAWRQKQIMFTKQRIDAHTRRFRKTQFVAVGLIRRGKSECDGIGQTGADGLAMVRPLPGKRARTFDIIDDFARLAEPREIVWQIEIGNLRPAFTRLANGSFD